MGLLAVALEVTVGGAAALAVAALLLMVAAFVLFLDIHAAVHRAFALMLLFKALVLGLFFFESTDLGYRLRPYAFIALPFAAAHFAVIYRRRHRRPQAQVRGFSPIALTLLMAASVFEVVYLVDHATFSPAKGIGPLAAFAFLDAPALAAIAFLMALEAGRATNHSARSAFLVAALALSIQPLFYSAFRNFDLLFDVVARRPGNGNLFAVLETSALLATMAMVGGVAATTRRVRRKEGSRSTLSYAFWGTAMFTGFVTAVLFLLAEQGKLGFAAGDLPYELLAVENALWALTLPVLVTYALIRYRLFDAEVRLRFAIKGTTLGAIFVGTFFVVAKITESGAQKFFDGNWIVGAVAAGLLLFAISPLQKLAEHLAHRAVPSGKPMTHLPHEDRVRIYREQLEVAWADGTLTQKERILFSKLQERLALTAEEAVALENEVVTALPRKTPRSNGRRAAA